jgi:hypothetical protein
MRETSILPTQVLELSIKTREEVGNAWNIEDLVIEEALQDLEAEGIKIFEVVHDDKCSVDTLLTNQKIVSQKDLWHKYKKLNTNF